MTPARLDLGRERILTFRRRVGALDERLPPGPSSLRTAAWAGLQDSMPRAALLSIHARVEGTAPDAWEDPSLVQLWGPRYSAYVVAAEDRGVFTLGRLPERGAGRRRAEEMADALHGALDGRPADDGVARRAIGTHPNAVRYAAPTGRVLIRWDGARGATLWTVPPPEMDADDARLELARRYLHVFGPGTAGSFAEWAGIKPSPAAATFEALAGELVPARTPIGDAWMLASDEATAREPARPPAPARLLPSGDSYYLLQGAERELLVPEPGRRARLWTSRVWPGAVLVGGEIAGTWRRAGASVTVDPWRALTPAERDAVAAEGASLPLPGLDRPISVAFGGPG